MNKADSGDLFQIRLSELDETFALVGDGRRLATHKGPANKVALLADAPHCLLSGGEDAIVNAVDVRQPHPQKLLTQFDGEKKVAIYSVDANPVDARFFCTAGRDKFVRVYDRRHISAAADGHQGPLKKFCPHHLVRNNASYKNVFNSSLSRWTAR